MNSFSQKRNQKKRKVIVIVGPTASGKSALAVTIAKKFNGEIISADSRQVYKGMDLGTGKITFQEMKGIPHHLLSLISPKTLFTAEQFKKKSRKKIEEIFKRERIPIICGGTGFYIQALIEGLTFPNVSPNNFLRKKLMEKNIKTLFKELSLLDPQRAKSIDSHNKHRLIRSIEIAKKLGKIPPLMREPLDADIIFIGIKKEKEILQKKIKNRLNDRLKKGMLNEILLLHKKSGISWKRLESFGLEYKWGAQYLKKEITYDEFIEKLLYAIYQYAKRQMTWFRNEKKINWITTPHEAKIIIKKFLS